MYPSRLLPTRAAALLGAVLLGGVLVLSACLMPLSPATAASAAPARVTPDGETLFAISCDWS